MSQNISQNMSQNILQNMPQTQSKHVPFPPNLAEIADLAEIISDLNEKMQALLLYSRTDKGTTPEEIAQGQAEQNLDAIQSTQTGNLQTANLQTGTRQALGRHASQVGTTMQKSGCHDPHTGTRQDLGLHKRQDISKNLTNPNPNAPDSSNTANTFSSLDTSNTFDLLDTINPQQARPLSKKAKRKECFKEYCHDPNDNRAFTNKETASYFDSAYTSGNFSSEIRYYSVPAGIVRHEHNLLFRHQQKDMMSLLYSTYNELDLRTRILFYLDKEKTELSLLQVRYSISQSLRLLHTIYTYLNNYKLVHKTMLSRRNKW